MELHKTDYWELVQGYLNKSLSNQQRTKLFQWLDEDPARRLQLAELEKLWERSENYQTPAFDTQAAWEKLQPQLEKQSKPVLRTLVWQRPFHYAASVALLLLAGTLLYLFLQPRYTQVLVHTLPGETKQLVLPDSSRVFLNERSSLSYDARLGQDGQRRVILKGEAFFEVSRDPEKKFIVQAGNTETTVLGTSFNIVSRDTTQQVRVSLFSGKVRFDAGEKERPQLLTPGEELIYYTRDKSLTKRKIENGNFLFWKNKKLEFTDQQLEDVLALIGKYYGASFEIQDQQLRGQRITSSFDHNSLDEVLQVLETLLDIRIERKADSYKVTAE